MRVQRIIYAPPSLFINWETTYLLVDKKKRLERFMRFLEIYKIFCLLPPLFRDIDFLFQFCIPPFKKKKKLISHNPSTYCVTFPFLLWIKFHASKLIPMRVCVFLLSFFVVALFPHWIWLEEKKKKKTANYPKTIHVLFSQMFL